MNIIDDEFCFQYPEVAELTGYSEQYVEKKANGNLEGGPDLSPFKRKVSSRAVFVTREGVEKLGTKDENRSDIEAIVQEYIDDQQSE